MRRSLSLVLVLGALTAIGGCDSSSPLAPTPAETASVALPTNTPRDDGVVAVAGLIQDRAWRSLLDGRVEVLDGPHAGLSARVDHRGEFRLAGVFDTTTRFRATASGHQEAILRLPERCDRCNPNWWMFFSLDTVNETVDLSGEYTLTFRADSSCTQIPEAFRTRTYAASVRRSDTGVSAHFSMTLRGGSFLPGYDRATLGVAGDYFALPLGDYHGTPGFAEEVAPRTYLGFEGPVEGSLASLGSGTITAVMNGVVSYCELSGAPSSHFGCSWEPTISRTGCTSLTHEVILQRTSSAR